MVVFTIDDQGFATPGSGQEAMLKVIRDMGRYLDKHFSASGGFSTRLQTNQFVTVLPYSDLTEAQHILDDFALDFQDRGLQEGYQGPERRKSPRGCIELAIRAGIAQGQPLADAETVIAEATSNQKEIARLRCDVRG